MFRERCRWKIDFVGDEIVQTAFEIIQDFVERRSQVSLRAVLKENAKQTRCRRFVFNAFPIIGIFWKVFSELRIVVVTVK